MKARFCIVVIVFFSSAGFLKAQTSGNWQPLAFASGMNSYKGVEGYCMPTICNGVESILIKWINHNSYPVKAGWKDIIYTLDNKQMNGNTLQDSVTMAPNSETIGQCGGNANQLVLKFSDFGTDMKDFKYLIAVDFDVVVVSSKQN